MTDYERFVADPAEPPVEDRLARYRSRTAVAAAAVLALAVGSWFVVALDDEDPSLQVPIDQLEAPDPSPEHPPEAPPDGLDALPES